MKEYALCFIQHEGSVLLIEKIKPDWQKGRLNLPGGSIEEGETPHEAAIRELFEEAGILTFYAYSLGVIEGPDWRVHVIGCVSHHPECWEQKTNEPVFWLPIQDALKHPKLIENLRTIIPIASLGVCGWTIYEGPYLPQGQHIVQHT